MQRVVVDCDPGMDDALALILALGSPELNVEAITCATGNFRADRSSINARRVLDLIGAPALPVAQGSLEPLAREWPRDPFSHGDDGLGNAGLPGTDRPLDPRFAPDVIVETVMAHPGEVTVIALAPMTNLALALRREPRVAANVSRIVATAGAFGFNEYAGLHATGDNPVSEWNVFVDPEAARVVFHAGAPVTAIGVDVWGRPEMNFRPPHLDALAAADTPAARFALRLVGFVEGRHYQSYTTLIDGLTVAAVVDPTLIQTERVRVDVETCSPLTLGQTVVDRRQYHQWPHLPEIDAARDADFERYLDRLVDALTMARDRDRRASLSRSASSRRARHDR